jgi:hypothetical protein
MGSISAMASSCMPTTSKRIAPDQSEKIWVNKKNEVVETFIDRNEMIQIDDEMINDSLVSTNDIGARGKPNIPKI